MTSSTDHQIQMALRGSKSHARRDASEQLVQIGASVVEPLIAALREDDVAVRRRATSLLGKIGDPRAVESLIALLHERDDQLRREAIRALQRIPDPRAVEPLIAALRQCSPAGLYAIGEEEALADALAAIGTPAIEPLTTMLTHPNANIREAVVKAIGKMASAGSVEPLIALLQDPSHRVRCWAAEALGRIGDPRAIDPLITAYEIDDRRGGELLSSVENALIEIGTPAVERLIAILKFGSDNMRYMAARALGEIGDLRAVEPLITALHDTDADAAAAEALGEIRDTRAIRPLTAALHGADKNLRRTIQEALETITPKTT
jgi:HEAT repeat protein